MILLESDLDVQIKNTDLVQLSYHSRVFASQE